MNNSSSIRKYIAFFSLAFYALAACVSVSAAVNNPATEGDVAVILINYMGYEGLLPEQPQVQDYVSLFKGTEINPKGGWNVYNTVNRQRLAEILIAALGYKDEVGPSGLGEMKYLESKGFFIGGNAAEVLTKDEVIRIIKSSPLELESARPYLTPSTPILPEEITEVVKDVAPTGKLQVAVYENGTAITRKAFWDVGWQANQEMNIAITYAHDASLPGGKSIIIYANGNPVGTAAAGKWSELSPDKYIWVGAQSQTGDFPANAAISSLKIYADPKFDFAKTEEKEQGGPGDLLLWTELKDQGSIINPRVGRGEDISARYVTEFESEKTEGAAAFKKKGQAALFPAEGNIDHRRGTIEFRIMPYFTDSDTEHSFFSTVNWGNTGGASGIYIYYYKEAIR
jgi:hypothetical protein